MAAYILDSLNNNVNSGTDLITLAIGTNPSGATLSGANNITATNGRADFNVSIDEGGSGYTLVATAAGRSALASWPFDVTPFGTATRLGFTMQPTNTAVGMPIAPAVQVCVQDGVGNTVTSATSSITIAIGANPGSAALGGTKTATAVSGCASFANLTLSAVGTGYTLTGTATGLAAATSSAYSITP